MERSSALVRIPPSFFFFFSLALSLFRLSNVVHLFPRFGNNVRVSMLSVASYLANHGSLLPLCVPVIHVLRTHFLFMLSYTPFSDAFLPSHSVQRGGRVEIIANDQGHRITPSWVAFTDDERMCVLLSVFSLILSLRGS